MVLHIASTMMLSYMKEPVAGMACCCFALPPSQWAHFAYP
jgi:hypothetical protein